MARGLSAGRRAQLERTRAESVALARRLRAVRAAVGPGPLILVARRRPGQALAVRPCKWCGSRLHAPSVCPIRALVGSRR